MICALDTNVLIWGLRRGSNPATQDLEKRARLLLRRLDAEGARVIVPTIAIAEFLAGVEMGEHGDVIAQFNASFYCPPFDLRASVIAAELWHRHATFSQAEKLSRKILKADSMIIATAVAAGASVFYSNDQKCRKLASTVIDAYDLPTHSEELFDNDEDADRE